MGLTGHCTAAVLALVLAASSSAISSQARGPDTGVSPQAPAAAAPRPPAEADVEFTLFLSGTRVGVEHVRVARVASTWVISSTAQYGAPLNVTVNRFELKYTAD